MVRLKLNNLDAKEKITESIRDLYTAKITLPLGNPNLKLVHTNQFLFTELPTGVFELDNFEEIAQAMNGRYSRYSGYTLNRWYVEEVTITNDGSSATMELSLNPFASGFRKYRDDKESFQKAFTDAFSSKSSNNTNVPSVKNTKTIDNNESKYINNIVKKIVGSETDNLKKAKLIHNHLLNYLSYVYYYDSHFSSAEKAYKHKKLNCADTSRVTASMFRSAGIPCYVVYISGSVGHYYTVLSYNNKLYSSDAVGSTRKFNYYWTPTNRAVKFKGKSSYTKKCGKNPCS